jgi:hypothetical protein
MGLPGYWIVLFTRAAVRTPRTGPPNPRHDGLGGAAFRKPDSLGTRDSHISEADIPRLDVLACLRIAADLTEGGARLATGPLAGLWPGGFRTRWTTNRIS